MTTAKLPGILPQTQKQPADTELPFLSPDLNCNARLHRGTGYCKGGAGQGTNHPGIGRCRLHGGDSPQASGVDGPLDLFRASGLGAIINLAETMTSNDQEYLMEVGNNALVVTRSGILARLQSPLLSPKEMADLTMALTRIDAILAKYPDDEDPDAAPNTPDRSLAAEQSRLDSLE